MPDQARFPMRERIAGRLAELARMLDGSPTPAQIAQVRGELGRIAGQH